MARTPAKGASSIPNASPGELWRYGCSLRHGLNRATTRCAGRRQWSPPDLLVIGSPKERVYSCRGREIVLELGGGNRNQLPNALRGIHSKRIQLENYLKAEKAAGRDKGQRTILHLMARLGLTEERSAASKLRQQTPSASISCRSNDPPCRRDTPRVR